MGQIDWLSVPEIEAGFRQFDADNPHVYQNLVTMTRQLHRRGHKKVGMKMLFEVLRWNHYIATETPEPFKLNNNYTAFYARMIEARNPDLRGVFAMRHSQADEAVA